MVGHAANILGIGDFWLSPYRIYAPKRINSRFAEASFATRAVDEEDIAWIDGLPVTKDERTLVNLCLDFEDPSLIEDALRDAASKGLDFDRLALLVSRKSGKGAAGRLLGQLSEAATRIVQAAYGKAYGKQAAGTDLQERLYDVCEAADLDEVLFGPVLRGEVAERRWAHERLAWE